MIEPLAIPVLLKAVDFLFGEGSKILAERRERRKPQEEAAKENPITTTLQSAETAVSKTIRSKEVALSQPITEAAWLGAEAKVRHLLALLEIYAKNYYLAREQYAKWGDALVPPIIIHNLDAAENGVASTIEELQSTLSKVYGKRVASPGV